ncbi:MAG: Na+/H+ antiporter subunit E, partial [bacterium]
KFDAFHLSLGVISCLIVSSISRDLLFKEKKNNNLHKQVIRFIIYLPWLIYQIIIANLHMAYLVLHPNMKKLIDPRVIKFKSKLKKDLSIVTFGNSITLTPGTITLLVKEGYFYVHAIDKYVSDSLPGDMEKKTGHIFEEY